MSAPLTRTPTTWTVRRSRVSVRKKSRIKNPLTSYFDPDRKFFFFSTTEVWSVWRRSQICWSRHTATSSTWRLWTTTSRRRLRNWRQQSSECTQRHSGCQFRGSTDSGFRQVVRSWLPTAMAHPEASSKCQIESPTTWASARFAWIHRREHPVLEAHES